jgi:hypothetical protein
MSALYQIACNNCSAKNDINELVCNTCGTAAEGTINTRRASLEYEINALDKRYKDAIDRLTAKNFAPEFTLLEQLVTNEGKAVINTNFKFLWEWAGKNSTDYVSYRRQIAEGLRQKAGFENDVKRCVHDSLLFGSEIDIIYAALSVDESGLSSYGKITAVIKTRPIEKRTSALQCNSYDFIEWDITQGWHVNKPLPAGFISTWFTKAKLALAKLEPAVKKGLNAAEIAKMVLNSGSDRASDDFIELHIFGKIPASAIEKVKIPHALKKATDKKIRRRLQELETKITIEYY